MIKTKKIIIILSSLLLLSAIGLYESRSFFITQKKPDIETGDIRTIDELILPYQMAIDEVNRELGTYYFIPDNLKEKVYNNIKSISISPDELKKQLLDKSNNTKNYSSAKKSKSLLLFELIPNAKKFDKNYNLPEGTL